VCEWLVEANELHPKKPRLLYFASGGVHTPQDLTTEWRKRAEEKRAYFSRGWDEIRAEAIGREKERGLVPENAPLAGDPGGVPALGFP
jgi:hypothetical protein